MDVVEIIDINPYSHIVSHMKTTLDLPDALLMEVKAVAARRRTTMRSIMEHALRRELGEMNPPKSVHELSTELNEYGFPVLKKRKRGELTSEMVYALQDQELD
jgi:hypothetical protein